jgi:hypothetical protein
MTLVGSQRLKKINMIEKQVLELKRFVPPLEKKGLKADLIKDFTSIARADGKGRNVWNMDGQIQG